MAEKGKKKLYRSEIVLYIIFGVIWLTGLVMSILGIIANNAGKLSTSALYNAQKGMAKFFGVADGIWDFRVVGTIFMAFALVCFLIAIFAYSQKSINEEAKARRKEERLKILMSSDFNSAENK